MTEKEDEPCCSKSLPKNRIDNSKKRKPESNIEDSRDRSRRKVLYTSI